MHNDIPQLIAPVRTFIIVSNEKGGSGKALAAESIVIALCAKHYRITGKPSWPKRRKQACPRKC